MAKSSGRPSRIWDKDTRDFPASFPAKPGDERRRRAFRIAGGMVIALLLLLIPPCAMRHCRSVPKADGFHLVEYAVRRLIHTWKPAPVLRKSGRDIKPEPASKRIEQEDKVAEPDAEKKKGAIADSPFGKQKNLDFGTQIELDPPPVTR